MKGKELVVIVFVILALAAFSGWKNRNTSLTNGGYEND